VSLVDGFEQTIAQVCYRFLNGTINSIVVPEARGMSELSARRGRRPIGRGFGQVRDQDVTAPEALAATNASND